MYKNKSILFSHTGGSEVLSVEKSNIELPIDNQVLIKNEAIGVNFIDIYHRSGLYPLELPSGLGAEGVGIVEAIGDKVSTIKQGDRVCYASGPLGAYSQFHTIPESSAIIVPAGIDFKLVAGMMLKGLTAAYLLLKTYPLSITDTLLVHAAAGGVGSILTQWAKHIGARVIGTVGRPEKESLARENGCDDVILYREQNVADAIMALTDGRGVDVVYDSVGKDTFEASINSLKPRGMLVSFGNASGAVEAFNPLLLAQKGSLYITRPTLGHYIADPKEQQELADELFDLVRSGKVTIHVNHEFDLEEADYAHRALESGNTTGAIILIP